MIYKLRGIDPDGDTLTFGVKEQLGHDILRIESFGVNEANVYLKKELDREVRKSTDVFSLLYSLKVTNCLLPTSEYNYSFV